MNDIYYEKVVSNALLGAVKQIMINFADGIIDPVPALYITFKTNHENVSIPASLKQKFPSEMTIVLQHQYEHLDVNNEKINVTLSFSGKKERLEIPFTSIISFYDMDAKFSLSFTPSKPEKTEINEQKAKVINLQDLKKSKK